MKYMFDLNDMVRIVDGSYKGLEGFIKDVKVVGNNTVYGIKISEYDELLYRLGKDLEYIGEVKEVHHTCEGSCGCAGDCGDACKCKAEKLKESCGCGCCHHEDVITKHDVKSIKEVVKKFVRKLKDKLKY